MAKWQIMQCCTSSQIVFDHSQLQPDKCGSDKVSGLPGKLTDKVKTCLWAQSGPKEVRHVLTCINNMQRICMGDLQRNKLGDAPSRQPDVHAVTITTMNHFTTICTITNTKGIIIPISPLSPISPAQNTKNPLSLSSPLPTAQTQTPT
ncbi:Uncharacterized protein Fot_40356 [Forsythia ovata]|uniref:Uncharacterized protein n=1 Tax=Forsythia ovata TaxID=205694 RepID=A0ABD1SAT0_9LAMI